MKPGHIIIFILVLFVFGIVFYALQKNNINPQKSALDVINQLTPSPPLLDFEDSQLRAQGQNPQQSQQDRDNQIRQALEEIKKASISATIKTTKGDITMELYGQDAPITVYNFVERAKNNFYNGLSFHRVEDWVIQGGDPKGDGTGGGQLPTEFNNRPYGTGSVGVARASDPRIQNDSQFFITKTDSPHLNGQYTNFGLVTSGMDVVNKIQIGDKIISIAIIER
jgi:peptidyl-prolyl cis-trans isomerase B (cyclophilin B)